MDLLEILETKNAALDDLIDAKKFTQVLHSPLYEVLRVNFPNSPLLFDRSIFPLEIGIANKIKFLKKQFNLDRAVIPTYMVNWCNSASYFKACTIANMHRYSFAGEESGIITWQGALYSLKKLIRARATERRDAPWN